MARDIIQLILVTGSVVALLLLSGCLQPPEGFVEHDVDGDGSLDGYAVDQNKDGVIDGKDLVDGEVVLVNEKLVKGTEGFDRYVPGGLATVGTVTGFSILSAVGALLKMVKGGKIFRDTVMAIQVFRDSIKGEDLAKMDSIVSGKMSEEAKALVKKIKEG